MRIYYYKLYRELSSISSEDLQFFETIIINFITDMLSAKDLYTEKISNTILILIDKLIKYTIYIATIKKLDAKNFAELL